MLPSFSTSTEEFSSSQAFETFIPAVPTLPALCEAQLEALLPHIPSSSSSEVVLDPNSSSRSNDSNHANDHPMETRAKSGISKHKDFSDYHCFSSTFLPPSELDELASYKIASYSSEWTKAMQEEIAALHMQGTWVLVPPPLHKNVVGSKWIYKIKQNSDGTISIYKARLVAQGTWF
ncbi:PREDICTED: Retrovirus-related Pol poly from transposon [Prunus dulcis]|uniref:PREDICTED: Retrovirus-related Pol poly from transposon n=1 Tax=Prunus dulcis TaxID=3755 RepID=A0A5E4FM96_PRUDU|nr:uncharacterized mitochondrial protein AtMg00820-like [Prunus dulcis]KAI5318467.1 hypothetical protein L3X38_038175 [Prunus dulcis]VVA28151.1 PREDICTED: Retrovirus-related Pol poly from transposon [Prunus dulcis]